MWDLDWASLEADLTKIRDVASPGVAWQWWYSHNHHHYNKKSTASFKIRSIVIFYAALTAVECEDCWGNIRFYNKNYTVSLWWWWWMPASVKWTTSSRNKWIEICNFIPLIKPYIGETSFRQSFIKLVPFWAYRFKCRFLQFSVRVCVNCRC